MIYLVGTDHELQHTGIPKRAEKETVILARDRFGSFLKKSISELKITLIAEEFSNEVLTFLKAESTLRPVAEEIGIEHRFCDPNIVDRDRIGLPPPFTQTSDEEQKRKDDELRENHWIDAIEDRLDSSIIFICGADHIVGFTDLLNSKGIDNMVLEEYWGEEIYSEYSASA